MSEGQEVAVSPLVSVYSEELTAFVSLEERRLFVLKLNVYQRASLSAICLKRDEMGLVEKLLRLNRGVREEPIVKSRRLGSVDARI